MRKKPLLTLDKWIYAPLPISAGYEQLILPRYRKSKDHKALQAAWNKRIMQESKTLTMEEVRELLQPKEPGRDRDSIADPVPGDDPVFPRILSATSIKCRGFLWCFTHVEIARLTQSDGSALLIPLAS